MKPLAGILLATAALLVGAGCGGASTSTAEDVDLAAVVADAGLDGGPRDLRPPPDLRPVSGPGRLADTGLYSDFARRLVAPGVVSYLPRYELWSDGAAKERYLALPPGSIIDTRDMDNWVFPVGTKVWKEFRVGGRLIETRLLEKVYDNPGGWWEMAYAWNADGTDAVANPEGTVNALGSGHDVPAQDECGRCHGNVSDVVIGVSAIQLSSKGGEGELTRLARAGLLSDPPAREFSPPGGGVVQDALGYVHGNCGHCHNERSEWDHSIQTRLRLKVADATPESTALYRTTVNVKMFHRLPPDIDYGVVPGRPDRSQLWLRAGRRDEWAMPPACTRLVDPDGLRLLSDWIASLAP